MAQDIKTGRRSGGDVVATSEEVPTEAASATTFVTTGPIPPLAGDAPGAPTASELAFGPARGPGVQALEGLLAKGRPEPSAVVELLDTHRGEQAAMFALLEARLGAAYVHEVRAALGRLRLSLERRELVAGNPGEPDGGYFIGSQREQGARWRTEDGRFTGTAGRDGLDTTYRLDDDDALHARIGRDRSGTLAWERDGKNQGELFGRYRSGTDHEVGLRRTWDVDGGALTTGVRHSETASGTTDSAFGSYRTADGRTTTDGALGVTEGQPSGSVGVTHRLGDRDTVSGSVAHDHRGTAVQVGGTHQIEGGSVSGTGRVHHGPEGTSGAVTGAYQQGGTRVEGALTRGIDQTSLRLAGSEQLSPQLAASGFIEHAQPDHGVGQTRLGIGERYRTDSFVQGLDLEAGVGARDYFRTAGSLDMRLAPQLYGGAWGSYQIDHGQHGTAQLGASLTFTPSEKTALTLAGVLDQDGALETRLQLDVFKSRIRNVSDLADHKKDALISLFVSYSQGGNRQMLDQRFGAPQLETGHEGQVRAGVRIKF